MNRLKSHRCYLAGPIDAAPDLGKTWRIEAAKQLKKRYKLKVFDPLTKPIPDHKETEDYIKNRHLAKELGNYKFVASTMKKIRQEDLRATDGADFGVFFMTRSIPHYGTMEEFVTMNRSKKPVLVVFEQGKKQVYDWLFGMVPHEFFFESFEALYEYLDKVSSDPNFVDEHNRWVFWEEDEKEKLKDDILSLAHNLLCEWSNFDHELVLNDNFRLDSILMPDGMVDSYIEFSRFRNDILEKIKLLQETHNA